MRSLLAQRRRKTCGPCLTDSIVLAGGVWLSDFPIGDLAPIAASQNALFPHALRSNKLISFPFLPLPNCVFFYSLLSPRDLELLSFSAFFPRYRARHTIRHAFSRHSPISLPSVRPLGLGEPSVFGMSGAPRSNSSGECRVYTLCPRIYERAMQSRFRL